MPFLCPGGSLWRLRKHSRHGGQGPKSRHQPTTSRQVSTRGTLAHPFTQKQVQVDEGLAMSPGSVGGVYLGPAKEQKKVSSIDDVPDVRTGTSGMAPSTSQDKKLAEIRSPTDYYTDGKVSIGHDVSKDVRSPVRQPATTSERTRHDDTLNPDGTLASIVFFEETFLSNRWSQLPASSPKVNLIPSRTQDATVEEPHINKISPVKGTLGGNRGLIPSWVRQRRCLPTLDELDFDQIDLISLHSYHASDVGSPGDHRNHLEADESDEAVLTDQVPSNEDRAVNQSEKQSLKKENDSHGKQVTDNRRSALGNLTNKKEFQASKSRTSNRSAFHTYKIPNGASQQEQRSQQTSRTSNARKQKLQTCDRIVTAPDKQNDHTYVNLNYIAGIMPGSPARQDHQKVQENDNSIHDYEKVWSTSPDKSSKLQRKMRHSQDSSPRRQALLADNLAKRSKRTVRERRQVDQTHAAPSRVIPPDECVDVSEQRPLLERAPATNQHNGSHPMRNLPIAPARTMKHAAKFAPRTEAPSSTSSWESTTASHSTEGDECAAILTGEVASKRPTHQARPRPNGCEGPIKASYDTHSRDEDVMYIIDHADGYREANFPGDQERKKLIGNPYVQNAARNARIVRTSSVDEKTRGRNSSEESGMMTKRPLKTEAKTWRPKKTPYVGTRRSLPAPPSQKALVGKMTPQQRSTTYVRAVEAKLCQRQNRKIRRTVEGDEVLDALLCQEKNGPEGNNVDNVGDLQKMDGLEANAESAEEVLLQGVHGGSPGREEAWHVERIIQDWKKTSQGQQGLPYAGSEVPSVPAAAQDEHPPHLATNRDQDARPNRGNGIQWAEGGRKARSLEHRQDPDRPRQTARKQPQTYQVEGSRQGTRRLPTAATKPDNAQGRRLTPSSVIEIYIAKEPYKPTERDEIEAKQGEILVVNSAMQRENDWMWVYVPRIDSFGYFPAFAACPLEFQPGVRVT